MRECEVVFAPEARDDLVSLHDRIADAAGARVALAYIDRLEACCLGLSVAPERGRLRNDIRPNLRIVGFERRVTVAYMSDQRRVRILRLFYGGRDWESILR